MPVQLTVTPILNGDRQPRGLVGIAVDLTDRRRAEAALRAAQAEAEIMEKALTDASGGVALIGLDGRFLRVKESVELLADLGVDFGQGYFLGRPKPQADYLPAPRPAQHT